MRSKSILPIAGALILASGCGDAPRRVTEPPPEPPVGSFITDIPMPTYDRSGQTVHPDFAAAPTWWDHGGPGYLAITPYPNSDASKENPSLFRGSADHWAVPEGAPNPVRFPSVGYLSDPDVLFNPETRELWMYYREVTGGNAIRVMRTRDAVIWSPPLTVVEGPGQTIVSPAVVRRAPNDWLMWSINSGTSGCGASSTSVEIRRSTDGLEWSTPETVVLPVPDRTLMPWHIDVQWLPSRGEFWAIFNAKDAHACGTTVVYLANSADGMHWQVRAEPLLVAGDVDELHDIVYRSTFHVDEARGEVSIWYSGAKRSGGRMTWKTVLQRMDASSFFSKSGRADMRLASTRALPPSVQLSDPP